MPRPPTIRASPSGSASASPRWAASRSPCEDLPGTYSLDPISPDEQVVADLLAGEVHDDGRPDAIVMVADATTLHRSIMLRGPGAAAGPSVPVGAEHDRRIDRARRRHRRRRLVDGAGHPGRRGGGATEAWASTPCALNWRPSTGGNGPQSCLHADNDAIDAWGRSVLDAADYVAPQPDQRTRGIDAIVLHPVWGTIIFFAVMFCFFQVVFTVAAPLQDRVGQLLGWLGGLVSDHVGNYIVRGLLGQGLIGGVGTVLQFIPQIVLLFLLIALLENVGYMARAAFLMDRVMATAGLEGRAFVAMLSSFACAIPGIMATRTLPSSRDRIATIITAPLMTCSARLPVFTVLVGMLVSAQTRWWGLSAQGVAMFLLYLCGGTSALIAASLFKSTILRSDLLPFTMELPPYRFPSPKNVLITMWDSAKVFLRKAGTIILGTSLVLWVLLSLPAREAETAHMSSTAAISFVMDHSYAADVGKAIGPVFKPLGFDWHVNVALLGSFSAREVFVSTLGQVSAAANPEDPHEALVSMTDDDGHKVFTAPTVIALMAYFVFALQCMSTVAVMRRETNSWRWPAFAWCYMFVLAWAAAFAARSIAIAVGA